MVLPHSRMIPLFKSAKAFQLLFVANGELLQFGLHRGPMIVKRQSSKNMVSNRESGDCNADQNALPFPHRRQRACSIRRRDAECAYNVDGPCQGHWTAGEEPLSPAISERTIKSKARVVVEHSIRRPVLKHISNSSLVLSAGFRSNLT